MITRTAQRPDWHHFFVLAAAEGWRVPEIERQLFTRVWPDSALALEIDDRPGGFVTAVSHQNSGWIGNLIVPQSLRGRGFGRQLFTEALEKLAEAGLERLLLTASELGRPLYQEVGFKVLDRIERWVLAPGWRSSASGDSRCALEQLLDSDRRAWGEDRCEMMAYLTGQGRACRCDDTVALLQPGVDLQIIGPWYSPSRCPRANRLVLQQLISAADPAVELVIDLVASSPVRSLVAAAGFTPAGENLLMIDGDQDAIDPTMMVALASLGSVG